MANPVKSCFNCEHIKTQYFNGSPTDTEHFEWECGHPDVESFPYEDIQPKPDCPNCKGTGFIDKDSGESVARDNVFVDAVECSCWDETDDDVKGEWDALNCPGYQFKDWAEIDRLQTIAEAEFERQMAEAEKALGLV